MGFLKTPLNLIFIAQYGSKVNPLILNAKRFRRQTGQALSQAPEEPLQI